MIREKRQTKIIWSLDCKNLSESVAQKLASVEPLSAVRIIYDPKYIKEILSFVPKMQSFCEKNSRKLPVMLDLSSQARGFISKLNIDEELSYGQEIKLSPQGKSGDIEIETSEWEQLFAINEAVYFGLGNVALKALHVGTDSVEAKVMIGGTIHIDNEIHVPATRKTPSIFDLSFIDIEHFLQIGIDYLVLPGVATAHEIVLMRDKLEANNKSCPWLIVRIENKETYTRIKGLLSSADGVLISRRELALTLEAATVPMISKEIIRECNEQAKLVFIASEMLGSLRYNPTPTRAEVSDLANAVIDGTDAIVLSEDINHGNYTERALALAASIINDVEDHAGVEVNWKKEDLAIKNVFDVVAYHAYKTAVRIKAKAIVCITKEGTTALRLASFRTPVPIIAVTFTERVKRRLSLVRGAYALVLDVAPHLDDVLPVVHERLKEESWLASGDCIVFVTVSLSPVGQEASNLFTVQHLE